MKKYVSSVYRILQFIMLLATIGLFGSIIANELTGNKLDSIWAFLAPYCYGILMLILPVAWVVGRLSITLNFDDKLD